MNRKLVSIGLCLAAALSVYVLYSRSGYAQQQKVVLYFFYGRECPHCRQIEPEVEKLVKNANMVIKKYEVWHDKSNRALLMSMAKERGTDAQGVPTIIIGKDVYLGSDMGKIRELVRRNAKK